MVQYLTPATNDIVDIINQIPVSTQNIECTPDLSTTETDALEPINDADLGCLCIPSTSSSLGGLCASSNNVEEIILSVESKRQLQGDEPEPLPFTDGICPNTCDQDLCSCAASTEEGFPDAQDCATELNAVCESDGTKDCFNAEVLPFYDNTYCTFSQCWLDSGSYEDCSCQYYEDYCTLYEAYATDAYPDVVDKCDIADCCGKAKESEDKIACMPKIFERMPSVAPSALKVVTEEPTPPPTNEPTVAVTESPTSKPTTVDLSGLSDIFSKNSAMPTKSPSDKYKPTVALPVTESPVVTTGSPTVQIITTPPTINKDTVQADTASPSMPSFSFNLPVSESETEPPSSVLKDDTTEEDPDEDLGGNDVDENESDSSASNTDSNGASVGILGYAGLVAIGCVLFLL